MTSLKQWSPNQWQSFAAAQGPALVELFKELGYDDKAASAILAAYKSDVASNLNLMKAAVGATEKTSDINYVWTAHGRMALMLMPGMNQPDEMPNEFEAADFITYDAKLRAWVADLGAMHARLMIQLGKDLDNAKAMGLETGPIEAQIQKYDANQTCEGGDWALGIALTEFFVVTSWIKQYYPKLFDMANKMVFWKAPGTKAPPFLQIREHRTCFFFKGREGPGSVWVNPELATPEGELREDLPACVYHNLQFTVDIIGGKPEPFPTGLNGKLTYLGEELLVIPMVPAMTKVFNPYDPDDAANSYNAFKNSHPDTAHSLN